MKLYYSKAACSLAPHIVLEELGLPYELVPVNLRDEPTPEYLKLNPMGAVPTLQMDNGQPLTEVAAILQYLGDLKPEMSLVPRSGTSDRYHLQERLNFIATELHKGFGPLWNLDAFSSNPAAREEIKSYAIAQLASRFDVVTQKLGSQEYLMSFGYSVADAYLYTVLSWAKYLKVDLARWPKIEALLQRVHSRPATVRALKAEHLM